MALLAMKYFRSTYKFLILFSHKPMDTWTLPEKEPWVGLWGSPPPSLLCTPSANLCPPEGCSIDSQVFPEE